MFHNSYESETISNGYVEKFYEIFDVMLFDNQVEKLEKLHELVDEWEDKYPEDANLHCARVILDINEKPKSQIEDNLNKAKELMPLDKKSYSLLLAFANMVYYVKFLEKRDILLYDNGTGGADWDFSNFRNKISYVDGFPFNVLEALVKYFETGEKQEVEFNAEGGHYKFEFSSKVTDGETVLNESIKDFAIDFILDLDQNLDSGTHFPSKRTNEDDFKKLVDLIVKVRVHLMDNDLIDKWIQLIS